MEVASAVTAVVVFLKELVFGGSGYCGGKRRIGSSGQWDARESFVKFKSQALSQDGMVEKRDVTQTTLFGRQYVL